MHVNNEGATMSDRPIAIDFYCCEGAASRGLQRAGFDVVGVDLFKHTNDKGKRVGYSQSRYPFPSWQGDAIEALDYLLAGYSLRFVKGSVVRHVGLADAVLAAGSPPCQHATAGLRAARVKGDRRPALIEPTRERFERARAEFGVEWVIENVSGAALREPTMLCGSMFDLRTPDADGEMLALERHRLFEASFPIEAPAPCNHDERLGWTAGVYGGSRRAKTPPGASLAYAAAVDRHAARFERHGGYVPRDRDVQRRLLGLPKDHGMTLGGMRECIPPAYAQWVGEAALEALFERGAISA